MWTLIVAIVVGFIAGLIARAIHPGNDKSGFIASVIGAIIILFLYNLIAKKSRV